MSTGKASDQRRLSGLFIAPDRQVRVALLSVGIGLLFFFAFFGFQLWMFSALLSSLAPLIPESSNVDRAIAESIRWIWLVFGVGAVAFTVLVGSVTVVLSHRIYGPIYAIRKHLAAIGKGEFDHRTHLRKNDEFKDVAQDLNALSEALAQGKIPPT